MTKYYVLPLALFFALSSGCATFGFDAPGDSTATAVEKPDRTDEGSDESEENPATGFVLAGAPVATADFKFESHGETLSGELVFPEASDIARPAVVIVHDSGPLNRDGIMRGAFGVELPVEVAVYRTLAEQLASRGFVVLIYDKRTCLEGAQPWCAYPRSFIEGHADALGSVLKEDLQSAVAALRADSRTSDVVHVIAHGHGADLALAADELGATSLVLASPNTQPLDAMILHQIGRSIEVLQSRIQSESNATTDQMVTQVEALEARKKELTAAFAAIRAGEDTEAAGLPAASWRSLFALHDAATGARAKVPMLVIEPGLDLDVDEDASESAMARWKEDGGEIVRFDELTRALVSVSDEEDPTTLSDQVIATIADFLTQTTIQRD